MNWNSCFDQSRSIKTEISEQRQLDIELGRSAGVTQNWHKSYIRTISLILDMALGRNKRISETNA